MMRPRGCHRDQLQPIRTRTVTGPPSMHHAHIRHDTACDHRPVHRAHTRGARSKGLLRACSHSLHGSPLEKARDLARLVAGWARWALQKILSTRVFPLRHATPCARGRGSPGHQREEVEEKGARRPRRPPSRRASCARGCRERAARARRCAARRKCCRSARARCRAATYFCCLATRRSAARNVLPDAVLDAVH